MLDKFKELQEKFPDKPTIIIFEKLIDGRKMSMPEIRKWFNKLVDRSDWEGSNKEEVLSFLRDYSRKEAWGQRARNNDILKPTRVKNAPGRI
jgi:hypothetical protein